MSGNAIDFLIQYDHLNFVEAVETLAHQVGLIVPHEKKTTTQTAGHPTLYALLEKVAQFYQAQLRHHAASIEYLKNRGVTGIIAKQFGIGYAPAGWDHLLKTFGQSENEREQLLATGLLIQKDAGGYYDRFRDRIMFPIIDRRGRIVGFGGRIIAAGEPKYLNSPETPIFQKGHELYGLYQALTTHRPLSRVLIVEGYMDVIALVQHGITYAVATLGTAMTTHHFNRLARHCSEIIFCFDGDAAGRTAAWRALETLLPLMKDDLTVKFLFLPDGEDPDSLIRKEGQQAFERRIPAAESLSNFFLNTLAQKTDTSTLDGRARLVSLAVEYLQKLVPGIFYEMIITELSKRARFEVEKIKQKLKTAAAPKKKFSVSGQRIPSTLRLVTTLLVQHPELISEITSPMPEIALEGYSLLLSIIEFLKQHPNINTGTLLEHWRESPESKILTKLARLELMVPESGLRAEFRGALQRLKDLEQDQCIDQLLSKAAQQGLSAEEKLTLQALIQNKNPL